MREIGGYIEADSSSCRLHKGAIRLNSGRNCLAYLIEARAIKRIWLPDYMCDSVRGVCDKMGVESVIYPIAESFAPDWNKLEIAEGDYLYLADYFGQLSSEDIAYALKIAGDKVIVDEVQSLFSPPHEGVDTLYSVRKFLGVPDGGFLYTNADIHRSLPRSESRDRASHLFGRLERTASEYFSVRKFNDEAVGNEPLMLMSNLTKTMIGKINLDEVKAKREENYRILEEALRSVNSLNLKQPIAPFAYPLLVEDGPKMRKAFAEKGVYIPTLWPNVLQDSDEKSVAYHYAADILPLPCDQRYSYGEMERIVDLLREFGIISNPFQGKKIAILGGTLISCEIVRCAKRMGMHTTVIDYNKPDKSPGKQISDESALISVADTDKVASYIANNNIDGVITGYSDALLPMYAEICEKANKPCYGSRRLFEIFTDKKKWKSLCREYDVPTAQEYDADIVKLPEHKLPLPLFVKPADAAGARGLSVVEVAEELAPAIDRAQLFSRNNEVVIEDYLEGSEVTVFWLFLDGTYEVFLLGNRLVKHNQEGVIPLPAGYTFPSSVLPRYLDEIAPKCKRMFAGLGIRNGMMFMQCIVRDGMPYVYDIGYRLTGSLEQYITKERFGYDPMEMLLSFAVMGKMTEDPYIEKKIKAGLYSPCYNISYLMKPGTIDHFEGIERVLADESVIAAIKAHVEGETLPLEAKGELRQIALRVLGSVDDAGDLRDTMLGLQSEVKIVSTGGDELLLPGLDPSDFCENVLVEDTLHDVR